MSRISIAVTVVVTLTGSLLVSAGPAHAGERSCQGTIGSVSVSTDIVVPSGATCTLDGTRVDGDVEVKGNGAVLITGGARIDGNVQAEDGRARYVRVRASTVLGDVQVESGGSVVVRQTTVDGNIQLERNRGPITVLSNTVDGDIQIFANSARAEIRNNIVDGNLQCKGNSPSPVGNGNQVAGNKEDQCRSM